MHWRAIVSLGIAVGSNAHASGVDVFGMGARWEGAGGGGVAVVEDGTAAYLNPAGLSRIRRPTAGIGVQAAFPNFKPLPPLYWDTNRDGSVDERDPPLQYSAQPENTTAVQLHVGRHVGGKFGLGVAASVPTSNLIRFQTFEPELPSYFMWENRLERFMIAAGIGGEILPGLSIGAAVETLAGGKIDIALGIDAAVQGPDSADTGVEDLISDVVIDVHEVSLAVIPRFAPIVGLQFDVGRVAPPLDGLVLGAMYHGSVGIAFDAEVDIQADVDIQDVGDLEPYVTSLLLASNVNVFDHYVPQRVQMGLAYRRADTLTLYGDAKWTDWSKMQLNVAKLDSAELTSPFINIDDVIRDGNQYQVVLRPVWSMRMGADLQLPEWKLDTAVRYVRLRLRGGFSVDPTPLVDQGSASALLDADRSMFSLGTGAEIWDPFALTDGPVRFDLFWQFHTLRSTTLPRSTQTPTARYPSQGIGIPIGGTIMVFGGEWSFEY